MEMSIYLWLTGVYEWTTNPDNRPWINLGFYLILALAVGVILGVICG